MYLKSIFLAKIKKNITFLHLKIVGFTVSQLSVGATVSVTFQLMLVHIVVVRFRLLCGHLLGRAAYSVDHMVSLLYDYL